MNKRSEDDKKFGAVVPFGGFHMADKASRSINGIRRWASAVAGVLCISTVGAAEITLYEDPGFNGGQLTLRGYTPNIGSTGFNDRASSVVVNSGRWELCTDADFRGYCATFTQGQYPTIDQRLVDRISSAREIGSNTDNRGSYNNFGRGSIELFGQPDFRGRTMRLDQDATTLKGTGFDDRASSVIVNAGTWQLCADDGYGGMCRTFTPGRYPNLGFGMAKEVSSARMVRSAQQAPAVISGGLGAGVPTAGRAVLYGDEGLRGDSVAVSRALVDLSPTSLGDDGAYSVYVESGNWTLCTNPNFTGRCVNVGPGRYDTLSGAGLRRPIASIRPAVGAGAPVPPSRRDGIELFSEVNFEGKSLTIDQDIAALARGNFDDRAASVIIYGGRWEFCTDNQYRGSCAVFGPGRYPRIGGMTGDMSSVRRLP